MALLKREAFRDLIWGQVVGDHAGIVEELPLLLGEREDFGLANRLRDNQAIGQFAERGK